MSLCRFKINKNKLKKEGFTIAPPKKGLNDYITKENYAILKMKNKEGYLYECYVDLSDLEILKEKDWSWHLAWSKTTKSYYAKTTYHYYDENEKRRATTIYLHRFIMNTPPELYTDHINHNTLDNRKNNLRNIDNYKSTRHRDGENRNSTSGHRNVSLDKRHNRWMVQFQVNGKNKCFKRFPYDELDKAIELADKLRKEIYGKFAGNGERLN